MEFSSEQELYDRLRPALITKRDECRRHRIMYISEADIWNYLKQGVWAKANNLSLSTMVHDILSADINKVDKFIKGNLFIEREPKIGD